MSASRERHAPRAAARLAPRLLFVPQSGGIGEYARCLTLADAVRERWPDARITFAVKPDTPRVPDDAFERFVLAKGPRAAALERVIRATAPDVVLFNNRGKARDLAAARRAGARIVYVASVPHYRRRGFRRRILRATDQLWLFPSDAGEARLRPHETRAWRQTGRRPVAFLDPVFAPPQPERAAKQWATLGLERDGYALFAPGGGGWHAEGRPCSEVYHEAALLTAQRTRLPAVVVAGPLAGRMPRPAAGLRVLHQLPQPALMDLVSGARVVVTGGGGLLHQALACGTPCAAAALQPRDQQDRVTTAQARGLLLAARPTTESLAAAAVTLLQSPARRAALRTRLAESGPGNALTRCIALLAPLLEAEPRAGRAWLRSWR